MDLQHLVQRESEERQRAAEATSDAARTAHQELADLYRDRITDHRAQPSAA